MENCACIYVDVDEAYDDSGHDIVVAGTEHKCCECQRVIDVGESYEDAWGGYVEYDDDDSESLTDVEIYETCLDCVSAREAFFCQGWYIGMIWEAISDHLWDVIGPSSGISSDCLASLTPRARERVCETIEEIWHDIDEDEEEDELELH